LGLFSFGGYGLALAALALVVFGAIECPPDSHINAPLVFADMLDTFLERVRQAYSGYQ